MEVFANIDECLNHFIERGFKLVKDTENYGSRTLSLRRYADGEPFEVIIKHVGTKISVVQTVNGKLVDTIL
jgi:hypothetical protein